MLWPGEAFSYPALEERLNKLIARLRKVHRQRIEVESSQLKFVPGASFALRVRDRALPSFLESRKEFERTDMARHYDLSKTQSAQLLREWMSARLVVSCGRGPATRYRVS